MQLEHNHTAFNLLHTWYLLWFRRWARPWGHRAGQRPGPSPRAEVEMTPRWRCGAHCTSLRGDCTGDTEEGTDDAVLRRGVRVGRQPRNREKVSFQLVFRIKRTSSDKHGRKG